MKLYFPNFLGLIRFKLFSEFFCFSGLKHMYVRSGKLFVCTFQGTFVLHLSGNKSLACFGSYFRRSCDGFEAVIALL